MTNKIATFIYKHSLLITGVGIVIIASSLNNAFNLGLGMGFVSADLVVKIQKTLYED